MNCSSAEELIQQSLDALLTPPERAKLDLHLQSCAACRRAWGQYRSLSRVAAEWARRPASEEMPAVEFSAQVMARVTSRKTPQPPSKVPLVAAAVCVALAAVSPLVAPWLPPVPRWQIAWPDPQVDTLWALADSLRALHWAEALFVPALIVNAALLLRARRSA